MQLLACWPLILPFRANNEIASSGKKKEWNVDPGDNYVWCTMSSSLVNITSFICSDMPTDKGRGKTWYSYFTAHLEKGLRKDHSVTFNYTHFYFSFMISLILPYCCDELLCKPTVLVPVSQIIPLWFVWFGGAVPSFQRRLCYRGISVTWLIWSQHSPKVLLILCCCADFIPHLSNWWS